MQFSSDSNLYSVTSNIVREIAYNFRGLLNPSKRLAEWFNASPVSVTTTCVSFNLTVLRRGMGAPIIYTLFLVFLWNSTFKEFPLPGPSNVQYAVCSTLVINMVCSR